MKATEQFFPVVLFIMKYKVVLTFDSVDEILKCNHSNDSYSGGGGGGGYFYMVLFIMLYNVFLLSALH